MMQKKTTHICCRGKIDTPIRLLEPVDPSIQGGPNLSVKDLDEELKDLVKWEPFARKLPKIDQTAIDIINKDHPKDTHEQKIALFNRWLRTYPQASWYNVVEALKEANENTIAENIEQKHLA